MSPRKLSDLPGRESSEVIAARIKNTEFLHEENRRLRYKNPIINDACNLDTLAKSMGLFVEYNEDLDTEEDL